MTANGVLQILLFFGVIVLLVKPLGALMAAIFERQPTVLDRLLGPVERLIYRVIGVDPNAEQHWSV